MLKRAFDILFSFTFLLIFSPVFLITSILIKLQDGGTVFYPAKRVGQNKKIFSMYKFRTMILNADKFGPSSTSNTDSRITRVGKFLRKYKLDELPQFINVLRGEMSIVGPRPQIEWAVNLYSEEEKKILSLKPGITDYASIRFHNEGAILAGSADPDKTYMEKIHPEKMKLSLEYLSNHSFFTDMKIIFKTIFRIFK